MNLPDCIEPADPSAATPILAVRADALEATLAALQPDARAWVQANGFAARPDTWIAVPDGQGGITATHSSGLYVSVWGSSIDDYVASGSDQELDLIAGYSTTVGAANERK